MTLHMQAFSASSASSAFQNPKTQRTQRCRAAGKAVLYAPTRLAVGDAFLDWVESQNSGRAWPTVADIPSPSTKIRAGQPIVTVFAEDSDEQSVLIALKALAAEAYRNLAVSPPLREQFPRRDVLGARRVFPRGRLFPLNSPHGRIVYSFGPQRFDR